MAANKTRPTSGSVTAFMAAIGDPRMRADARKVATMMRRATGKSCLNSKRLEDIDAAVLERLIRESVDYMRAHYQTR